MQTCEGAVAFVADIREHFDQAVVRVDVRGKRTVPVVFPQFFAAGTVATNLHHSALCTTKGTAANWRSSTTPVSPSGNASACKAP